MGNLQLRSGFFIAQEVCELTWNLNGREYGVFRFIRQITTGAERCPVRSTARLVRRSVDGRVDLIQQERIPLAHQPLTITADKFVVGAPLRLTSVATGR